MAELLSALQRLAWKIGLGGAQGRKGPGADAASADIALSLGNRPSGTHEGEKLKTADRCPYCSGKDIIRKGLRKKRYETQQLYFCNDCSRVFTPQKVKGKQFPLKVILDGLSLYNQGFTLEESCGLLKERYGLEMDCATLSRWVKEYAPICRYARMRDFGLKLFSAQQAVQSVKLYHRQVYNFMYHKAKLALILQDFKHSQFEPLREFLDLIAVECPHELFTDSRRASEVKPVFNLSQVLIREKTNFANRIADLVLQAVNDNKLRHETLQRFMLCNDSVTVATEVPLYLDPMDVEHMREKLGFVIPIEMERTLTGHLDILQVRNGSLHLLDYKPKAKKERPIEQLTLYALALSRLTGIRLFHMVCSWFDEEKTYIFYPLHVVYKKGKRPLKESEEQMGLPI